MTTGYAALPRPQQIEKARRIYGGFPSWQLEAISAGTDGMALLAFLELQERYREHREAKETR